MAHRPISLDFYIQDEEEFNQQKNIKTRYRTQKKVTFDIPSSKSTSNLTKNNLNSTNKSTIASSIPYSSRPTSVSSSRPTLASSSGLRPNSTSSSRPSSATRPSSSHDKREEWKPYWTEHIDRDRTLQDQINYVSHLPFRLNSKELLGEKYYNNYHLSTSLRRNSNSGEVSGPSSLPKISHKKDKIIRLVPNTSGKIFNNPLPFYDNNVIRKESAKKEEKMKGKENLKWNITTKEIDEPPRYRPEKKIVEKSHDDFVRFYKSIHEVVPDNVYIHNQDYFNQELKNKK